MKIKVIEKGVGRLPHTIIIDNDRNALAKQIDALHIAFEPITTDLAIVYDPDWYLTKKKRNISVCGILFSGKILLVGLDRDRVISLPYVWQDLKKKVPDLFIE